MMAGNFKDIKLDSINKKILSITHLQSDISNRELADQVGLSPSACFQRVKGLKDGGYFLGFHTELDLNRIVEHVLAYVEFTLENNSLRFREAFEQEIEKHPEFMDCRRVTGETDYICFTCCSSTEDLATLIDLFTSNKSLCIKTVKPRILLERSKPFRGYPLEKLQWREG